MGKLYYAIKNAGTGEILEFTKDFQKTVQPMSYFLSVYQCEVIIQHILVFDTDSIITPK